MECSVSGCARPVYVKKRGWCSRHYNRWILSGHPEAPVTRIYYDDAKRFWSKVNKTETCWLWTGCTTKGGYGRFTLQGPVHLVAHRWIYEQEVGPIAPGHQVDHLCRVRLCVRPDHLEAVTQAENLRRENVARGRTSPPCSVDGCGGKHRCFGLCTKHFTRWTRAGRPPLDQMQL